MVNVQIGYASYIIIKYNRRIFRIINFRQVNLEYTRSSIQAIRNSRRGLTDIRKPRKNPPISRGSRNTRKRGCNTIKSCADIFQGRRNYIHILRNTNIERSTVYLASEINIQRLFTINNILIRYSLSESKTRSSG